MTDPDTWNHPSHAQAIVPRDPEATEQQTTDHMAGTCSVECPVCYVNALHLLTRAGVCPDCVPGPAASQVGSASEDLTVIVAPCQVHTDAAWGLVKSSHANGERIY